MRVLDLFSGIGGFALAARWMGWETVQFVEIDGFCQKVLKKNFPNVPIHGDIKTFNGTGLRGTVDLITGGFPCQPFSNAGKRRGTEDDRYLWPEMLRIIREVQPAYLVGENVYGIINWSKGLVFEQVCADLENEGYHVQPVILPACGINAPHRRDRVWFVAYSKGNDDRRIQREFHQTDGRQVGELLPTFSRSGEGLYEDGAFTNTNGSTSTQREYRETGCEAGQNQSQENKREWVWSITERIGKERIVTNADAWGLERSENKAQRQFTINRNAWNQFPTQSPLCGGNDGLPNRVDRIKSLGNAIVPQVAHEIFKAIEITRKGVL